MKSFKFLKTRKILEKRAELDNQTLKIKSLNQAFPSVFPNRSAGYFSHKIDCALAASYRQSLYLFMTSENLNLNGLHFSFEIFIWMSFFLQCLLLFFFKRQKLEQNSNSSHATILQLSVAKIATDNCNLTLQYIVAPIAAISWKKLQPRVACN